MELVKLCNAPSDSQYSACTDLDVLQIGIRASYRDKVGPEEDPEEYEDNETEDGPVDYPMDGEDDRDDDDGDSSGDDADGEDEDDEDEEEKEEHFRLRPASDFPYHSTRGQEVERTFLAMTTPSPSPQSSLSTFAEGALLGGMVASTHALLMQLLAAITIHSTTTLPSSRDIPPPVNVGMIFLSLEQASPQEVVFVHPRLQIRGRGEFYC
ncbi:hypothetical protein Tco_0871167 [Tanacetum coccineum]